MSIVYHVSIPCYQMCRGGFVKLGIYRGMYEYKGTAYVWHGIPNDPSVAFAGWVWKDQHNKSIICDRRYGVTKVGYICVDPTLWEYPLIPTHIRLWRFDL